MENTILNTKPCETCKYVEKEIKQGQLIYSCKAGKFVPNGDMERVCRQYEPNSQKISNNTNASIHSWINKE